MIIMAGTQAIKKEVTSTKSIRALQSIETASQRASSLTRQLLSFARRQSVQPQTIRLAERFDTMRDVLKVGLGSTIDFSIDVMDGVWNVVVDPSEFETALLNLVVNARDALPDGGSIAVRAVNDSGKKSCRDFGRG